MDRFLDGLNAVNRAMFTVSAFLLAASVFVSFFNAMVRRFFAGIGGFTWAEEFSAYCCVLMLFIGTAYLEMTNQHLRIGVIQFLVKNEKAFKIVDHATRILRGVLTVVLLGVVLRYGFVVLQHMYSTNMLTYAMGLPKLYFFMAMLVGFAMTIVIWVVMLVFFKGKEVERWSLSR